LVIKSFALQREHVLSSIKEERLAYLSFLELACTVSAVASDDKVQKMVGRKVLGTVGCDRPFSVVASSQPFCAASVYRNNSDYQNFTKWLHHASRVVEANYC